MTTIPHIKGQYLLGCLPAFKTRPVQAMTEWRETYGDLLSFNLAKQHCYLISHPYWVEQTLIKRNQNFVKMYDHQKPRGLALVLGQGLVTSQGALWKKQRRLMQPVFQRNNLKTMLPQMRAATENMLSRWHTLAEDAEVNLAHEMMTVTLDIINQTMFSTNVLSDVNKIAPALEIGLRYAARSVSSPFILPLCIPTTANRQFKQAQQTLDSIIFQMIEQRQTQAAQSDDLLDMLLNAADDDGQTMNHQQIRDEVLTIFTAGHETTANLLTWTLYLLAKNPAVLSQLRNEQQALQGKAPEASDLQNLSYTRAVLNEAMRVRPPVGILMRKVTEDTQIDNYCFKAGSLVIYSIYNIHHHPELWPQPEIFDPTRFLHKENQRYSFMPFGSGERICIGNHFAMLESQLLLTMILQQYEIQLINDDDVAIDMTVTLRPKGGIPVRLKRKVDCAEYIA